MRKFLLSFSALALFFTANAAVGDTFAIDDITYKVIADNQVEISKVKSSLTSVSLSETVSDGTNTYTFTVESYLCGEGTDVYTTVTNLNVGDVIDVEGFLYWYNGAQPHVTSVTVK